ncbi:hypothetical protein MCOR02_012146 [Pyricularia oryzae]|uniref:Uncharacterized protein n=1 Tax=Pyricularia oryzae TaxID=318829 RepID=A0A4P7NVH6_PYROR|nr:hypothetical protein MCOR02_012146 [Pyricularia oryzae]KAI6292257.1 hypothetical protein MCOR34_010026 [Pyricularia oryzae]KAI6459574.1 hypothetical protein MCOR17_006948 [Pyricularia oryzae]KAI6482498.1 hypothetical protein MCOR13_010494 [Pyricularia oryzae]KAI6625820.1 hypothetical protein MCOR14_009009 [Pyricularia oryzae]
MPQVVEDIRKVLRTTEESLTRLGHYNHVLLAELFLEQSSRWLPIAIAHVESIIVIVTGWLQHATRVVLPKDKLRGDVLSICSQWIEDAGNDALMELDKLKKDEQRQPITYNHYYTDNFQKSRHGFLREAVEGAIKETASSALPSAKTSYQWYLLRLGEFYLKTAVLGFYVRGLQL